jgi:hypothetical protein
MGLPLAIASALASIVGTVSSIQQGKKARRAREAQNRKVKAINAAKASSARRRVLREQRVRRAQLAAQAEAGGFTGSSTAILGEGRSTALAASSASAISNSLETTNALSRGNQSIQDSIDRQQLFANLSAIGSTVFDQAGGFETLFDNSAPVKTKPVKE